MQDEIVDLIYDTIVDASALERLPRALADHMHADSNWILIGIDDQVRPVAACVNGFDDDFIRRYENEGHRYDPWKQVAPRIVNDIPTSLQRLVSQKQFESSRAYQELARGKSDIFHCISLIVTAGATRSSIALQRGRRRPAFDEADERRLTPFLPHLRRLASALIRRGRHAPVELETLVAHPDPVIVVDQTGYPIHSSARGAALLDAGTVLAQTAAGSVRSIDPTFAIAASVRNAALRGIPEVRQINPPCGAHFIAVDPCPGLPRHATITVRNQQAHAHRMVESAGRRFSLTDAERRLATSLIMGMTLEEHCLGHGVSISTGRSQLKTSFAKTDVRRQSDLVRLILAPPVS